MENINTIVFAKLKPLPSQISPLSLLSAPSVNGGLNRGFMVPPNVYNVSFFLNLFRLSWENAGSYSCFFLKYNCIINNKCFIVGMVNANRTVSCL